MKISIFNIIKNYSIRSLFIKYWIIIFSTILVPCLALSYFKSAYDIRISQEETSNAALFSTEKIKSNIENVISSVESQWITVSSDNYVQMFLSKKELENNLVTSRTYTHIYDMLNNFIVANEYIDSIYIYNPKNDYVFSTQTGNHMNTFYDTNWYEPWREKGNSIFYRNTEFLGKKHTFLTICRNIYYEDNIDGVMVVNISSSVLSEMLLTENGNADFFITTSNGNIIYSGDADTVNTSVKSNKNIAYFKLDNLLSDKRMVRKNGNKLICRVTSESTGLKVFSVFTFAKQDGIAKIQGNILWFIILIFFISCLVSYMITTKIYASILKIINVLQNPYNETTIEEKSSVNELNFITQNIISVFKKNYQIEEELAQKLALLKNAQAIALYTQINPHFLFNTLQLINTIHMSEYRKETKVTQIVSLLSDILSSTLDTHTYVVPLRTELEYLNKYAEILKIRYDNMFTITYDIAKDAMDLNIVKFSLQPILENSVQHGILPLRKNGHIEIKAYTTDNKLIVIVHDNGSRITLDKLEELRRMLSDGSLPEKNSIGLLNVHQRIRLLFGDEYGCHIDSDENGTTVTLTMKKTKHTNYKD